MDKPQQEEEIILEELLQDIRVLDINKNIEKLIFIEKKMT